MSDVILNVTSLYKHFPKVTKPSDRFRALGKLLLKKNLANRDSTHVLKDINMHVRRGQSVGLIGENGAGKSTLLKVLTGVLAASSGEARISVPFAALLELGAGFNPEYTGIENIRMAGALMGLTQKQIKKLLPSIENFAEIGDSIYEPIKHYSSGMVMRLGFALATSIRPELLITDEVLAVGDESFQKKCVNWIEDFVDQGGTLLLVSHSMYHIQKLCKQAYWIKDGRLEKSGDVFDVTQGYLAYHEKKNNLKDQSSPVSSDYYRINKVLVNHLHNESELCLKCDESLQVDIVVFSPDKRMPVIGIGLVRADGTPIYGTTTEIDGHQCHSQSANVYDIRFTIDKLPLLPGQYALRVHVFDPEGIRLFDTQTRDVKITGKSREFGFCRIAHRWSEGSKE